MKKYDDSAVLIKNIINKIDLLEGELFYSDFMDPSQQKKLSKELDNYSDLKYDFFGGYEDSERKIFGIFYRDNLDSNDWPILVVCFEISDSYKSLDHRMVLGSVMSLGITRETLGDIIINKNNVQIIVKEHIAPYIRDNLREINRKKIMPEIKTVDNLILPEQQYKDETIVVNSMRIDGIISSGWHISRGESTQLVKKGVVRVNHESTIKPSFIVSVGDLISVKGKGRFIVQELLGNTRKEKNKIHIKKYL